MTLQLTKPGFVGRQTVALNLVPGRWTYLGDVRIVRTFLVTR